MRLRDNLISALSGYGIYDVLIREHITGSKIVSFYISDNEFETFKNKLLYKSIIYKDHMLSFSDDIHGGFV